MKLSNKNKSIVFLGLVVISLITFIFVSNNFNFGFNALKQKVINTSAPSAETTKSINTESKENQSENHFNLIGIINKIIPN